MAAFDRGISQRLPEFPPLPQESRLPEYKPSVTEVKEHVGGEQINIPQRRPMILPRTQPIPQQQPLIRQRTLPESEKPLFIRLDAYKEAVKAIDALREKVKQTENIVTSLEKLHHDEQQELDKFQKGLQEVKTKLLAIDKHLFEV